MSKASDVIMLRIKIIDPSMLCEEEGEMVHEGGIIRGIVHCEVTDLKGAKLVNRFK
jgi:hypothetical protein